MERDRATSIALHRATRERIRALLTDGQTFDDWLVEAVESQERSMAADHEQRSYAAVPESTPDEWGDLTDWTTASSATGWDASAKG